MKLSELSLPQPLVKACEKSGINKLYPPQAECIEKGLLEGKNLLISIPTASGKTLVAEMAMHSHIAKNGKCLYVVPLKALASEKYDEFSGKGVRVGIATGDLDKKDEYLGKNDIIITTSEKADSLLRNRAKWMDMISCLVVDEAHLIDSEDRGATLEMVITKLRYRNENMQIIALTATIGNPRVFSGWLEADHVTSDWRPVELKEGVYYSGTIFFEDGERPVKTPSKEDDTNLCLDCITEGGQCLVFVNSRRNAEGFAKRMAKALEKYEPASGVTDADALESISKKLGEVAETDMGKTLALCTKKGASFHHAGMKKEQRQIVEKGFRDGKIKVISSTPTLAAGLNLPARRVIIRDFLRFKGGEGMVPIPVREYRQMAGRAGRPHLDPYGESVLIAKGRDMANGLYEEFIDAPAEDVRSRLDDEYALCAQVLSLISTEFVKDSKDLVDFLERTFYVYINKKSRYLSEIVENSVSYLESAGMITNIDGRLSATEYGNLVSRLYINPASAEMIAGVLREKQGLLNAGMNAKKLKTKVSEEDTASVFSDIGLLQLLCKTPDMFNLYVKKDDMPVLEKFYYEHEDELWLEISYETMEDDYRALKTAMVLDNWISEVGENMICTRFGIGPGDVYNAVEGMNWLLYSASRISRMMSPDLKGSIAEVELRMKHGIKRELIPLVKLRNIGRVRARRLFNNGITGPSKIKTTGFEKLSAILGKKIAAQVMDQAEREERDYSDFDRELRGGSGEKSSHFIKSPKTETKQKKAKKNESSGSVENEGNPLPGAQKSIFEF
ncbi:helicase [Methanomicrobium sp. W14]|uniref:ATP-dependent DNA helicase n=1 Tax=Methanomicrobium sp. W14 TaxID=2817839 RepID=UPI001AE9B53A|nr:ATP-dependent DNA helicase [Methanomicrobium sp. W14]MBP2133261.1 helicase [Methanomicrobium sp. W14]